MKTLSEQITEWTRKSDKKTFGVPNERLYARVVVAVGVLMIVGSLISLAKSVVGAF